MLRRQHRGAVHSVRRWGGPIRDSLTTGASLNSFRQRCSTKKNSLPTGAFGDSQPACSAGGARGAAPRRALPEGPQIERTRLACFEHVLIHTHFLRPKRVCGFGSACPRGRCSGRRSSQASYDDLHSRNSLQVMVPHWRERCWSWFTSSGARAAGHTGCRSCGCHPSRPDRGEGGQLPRGCP